MQSLNDYLVHYLNSEPLWSFQQSVQRDALLALPLTELRLVVPITHRDSKDSAIHFIVSAGNAILSNHLHYIAAANDIKPQCGPTSPVAVTRISHAGGLVNSPVKYLIIDDATLFDISSLSSVWNMLARDEVSIIVLGSFEPFPSASARSLYLCGGISFEGHFLRFLRLQLEEDKVLHLWREKLERLEAIVRGLINLLINSSLGCFLR